MGRTIPQQAYKQRRDRLMQLLEPESIVVIPSAPEKVRSRDTDYRYRPDSDLYYLSGFKEPESLIVLVPGREGGEFLMFCRERDPKKEIWDGIRAGVEGAKVAYSADESFPISALDDKLPVLMEGKKNIYYPIGLDPEFEQRVLGWLNSVKAKARKGVEAPTRLISVDEHLHEMRLIKDDHELEVMREAAEISAQAHIRGMKACRPGLFEYQLDAEYSYHFQYSGCSDPAYTSIVGGGKNACILHYIDNCDPLMDGDLVLVDAGGELQGYAADITRTFPVNGTFSQPQKQLYSIVLKAQLAAIEQVKPGNTWNMPHEAALKVLTQGLVELGLLNGEVDDLIEKEAYKPFYMHKTGHWIGLDVHDVGRYKIDSKWRRFELGMVLTVEPGLYIGEDHPSVDAKWKGIGIRIEDNILVTANGNEVLTASVPKAVDEIEALMRGQ